MRTDDPRSPSPRVSPTSEANVSTGRYHPPSSRPVPLCIKHSTLQIHNVSYQVACDAGSSQPYGPVHGGFRPKDGVCDPFCFHQHSDFPFNDSCPCRWATSYSSLQINISTNHSSHCRDGQSVTSITNAAIPVVNDAQPITPTTLVTSVIIPGPVMAARAAKIEPRKPDWRDGRDAAISRAREAAGRGRQQGEDGRRKGQDAGGANDDTAAHPFKSILNIFGIGGRSPTPTTVATANNLALITEVPKVGAREPSTLATSTVTAPSNVLITTAPKLEPREPDWRDALDAALSRASEAAARGSEKGAQGRQKAVEVDLGAAERERDQAMDKVRRSLTAMIHDWRDDLSSAKSLESSYRSCASSIVASASSKNNSRDKTTSQAKAWPISPPASLPSDVRVNSAELLPPITLPGSLAGVGVIAGAFGML